MFVYSQDNLLVLNLAHQGPELLLNFTTGIILMELVDAFTEEKNIIWHMEVAEQKGHPVPLLAITVRNCVSSHQNGCASQSRQSA